MVTATSTSSARLVGASGGEVVVAALAAHDVELVFGIPGTHNLSVFDALHRYGIRTVATTHEQGAGFAADGYARTSGRPGVAIVTSGPAVYNAATPVAQAYSDSIPLLLVSPGMPRDLPTGGPGSGYLHEAKDQTGAMSRIAERCLRAMTHQEIADAVVAAFTSFGSGRPRPVHIEVPLDLLEEVGDATLRRASSDPLPAMDEEAIRAAAGRLHSAVSPMVIAGGGARGASGPLRLLAERLGAPVVTTINGKGVLDEQHPLALGSRLGTTAVLDAADTADVLLLIGTEVGNSDLWQRPLQPRGHVVRIDIDPRMSDVNVSADTFIAGDAASALQAIIDLLSPQEAGEVAPTAPDRVPDLRTRAATETQETGRRWLPWIEAIEQAMPSDAIVPTDNAMCVYFGAVGNLTIREPSAFLFPAGFGTLGFAVPVAVGAALAAPHRHVIAITGDGGFLFTATELSVAAAERLPITVILFDNGGYGEIRAEMIERGEKPTAVDAPPRNLVQLAHALGAHAMQVSEPKMLVSAIADAANRSGPTVLVIEEPSPPKGSAR